MHRSIALLAALALPLSACGETATKSESSKSATTAKSSQTSKSSREKMTDALPKGAKVQSLTATEISIKAKTPEGGFDGASTKDLDQAAGEIFQAIYGDAGYNRTSVVVFSGGLVDTETGADSDANTGIYTMPKAKAKAIDWTDDDVQFKVNFQNFRDFAHPALKTDDDDS